MKSLFIVLALSICQLSIAQSTITTQVVKSQSTVQATFENTFIDLGEVVRGESRDTVFTFVNTGKEALEIELASGCECTTLDWTRGPIAPGGVGKLYVHFDSTEKEASEVIELDINFKNTNPATGGPYWLIVEYGFELLQK
jgi:hypothetical protein